MNLFFTGVYPLHYTEHLERSGKIAGTIMLVLGSIILLHGIYNVFIHIRRNKTQYSVVLGKVAGSEKATRAVRRAVMTDYYPILEFEYKGRKYSVKSTKALGIETITAFEQANKKGDIEIRVPTGNPEGAFLNYEFSRNEKLYAGLKVCILGVILIAIVLFFRLR